MTNNNSSKAMRLEMVKVDQSRFAVEIISGNARINLTQMAKPFGESKKPVKWLRTDEAKEYLRAVAEVQKCPTADLVEVRKGGMPETQGTWCLDRRIALRFAQWLSPEFSLAVDDVLMRMMLGETVVANRSSGRKKREYVYPKDRSEELANFYAELGRWVTHDDESEVARFFEVSLKHVHEVLCGRRSGFAVLSALVSHGMENRKNGVRRVALWRDRSDDMRELYQDFMNFDGKED